MLKHKIKLNSNQELTDVSKKRKNILKTFFANTSFALSQLLFPSNIKCICCGRDLPSVLEVEICQNCLKNINFIDENNSCKRCGAKLVGDGSFCLDCMDKKRVFDAARCVCSYEGEAQKLIYGLKFGGKTYFAGTMSKLMANKYQSLDWDCDIVLPVPISKKRLKTRGYNQSLLLAKVISKTISKPLSDKVLLKIHDTHDQVGLGYDDRQNNLNGSIVANNKHLIKGKNVLLIDDVMTTGATANVCADVLFKAGAAHVYVLTFAYAMSKLRTEKNAETK
ncbi:MAG: ComF family protein [Clostridia bacterium]|nr:ComF family protein [Clostridia bacterium]